MGDIPIVGLNDDADIISTCKLASIILLSNESAADASINLTAQFGELLTGSASAELDRGVAYGQDSPEPIGLVAAALPAAGEDLAAAITVAAGSIGDHVLLHVLSHLGRGRRFRAQAPRHQPVASSASPRGQGPPPAPGGPVPGPDGGLGNNGGDRAHPSEHPRGPGLVQNGQGHPQHLGPADITSHPGIVAQAARVCQYAPQYDATGRTPTGTPVRRKPKPGTSRPG